MWTHLLSVCLVAIIAQGFSLEIDDIQNFRIAENTFCSIFYRKVTLEDAACRAQCTIDDQCVSYSHNAATKECFFQTHEAKCGTEVGWTTNFKDQRCSSAVEGAMLTLQCPEGSIISEVTFASYGTPTGTCGHFQKGTCHHKNSFEVIEDLCIGENHCQISASSHVFGEPCPIIAKNLRAQVKCIAGKTFNEDHYFNSWSSRQWPAAEKEITVRQQKWKSFVAALPPYPGENTYSDRGIVIVAGGKYLENALVQIKMLRAAKSALRIQVWHLGKGEMTPAQLALLQPYNVETRDFEDYVGADTLRPIQANVGLRLFQLKPLAVLHSDLKDIMLLDSDNVPLADPAYLFDSPEYVKFGSIFWPDYWMTASENPIWKVIGSAPTSTWEQESGQLLVNKALSWKAINLCVHLNDAFYMKLLNGDKDTFRFAWLASGTPFHMVPHWPTAVGVMKQDHTADSGFCAHSMVQSDLNGKALFVHHNQLKGTHFPRGENFKLMRLPDAAMKTRAVPVRGIDLKSGESISCTDVQSTNLPHVDADAYPLVDAGLSDFEQKYFDAKESIPKEPFAQFSVTSHANPAAMNVETSKFSANANQMAEASRILMEKLRRADSNTTCDETQFELEAPTLVNDRLCETVTTCQTSQIVRTAPTTTTDRVCEGLAGVDTTRKFSVRVRDVKSSAHPYFGLGDTTASYEIRDVSKNGPYLEAAPLVLTRLAVYDFQMDTVPSTYPFIVTLDDVGGVNSVAFTDGVVGSGVTGTDTLSIVPSSATPSILYYHSQSHSHMGWRFTVKDATYSTTYQGRHAGHTGALQRFSTAYSPSARLFTESDYSGVGKFKSVRDTCQATCSQRATCQGIFVYRTSAEVICHGLSDISGQGVPTTSDSQSLVKIIM